jgi:hypothetical protein
MLNANHASLFFTVAMLAVTTYFLFGSIPLLILKHDNTMDAKFIRSFYLTYFKFAIVVTTAATVSYALAARPLLTLEAAAIATRPHNPTKNALAIIEIRLTVNA